LSGRKKIIKGTSISSGIVMGTAHVIMTGDFQIPHNQISASKINKENDLLEKAVEKTIVELQSMREAALRKAGGPVAKIFDAQLLIAGDSEFLNTVKKIIRTRLLNAAFAYNTAIDEATAHLKNSSDLYMQQMAIDIEAVANKVLRHLTGEGTQSLRLAPNTIVVGESFSPNDIISYRNLKAIGFVTAEGGADSHMSLIARSFSLPVVLAEQGWKEIKNNSRLILDGSAGEIIINPTDDDWSEYLTRRKSLGPALITRIRKLSPFPPVTSDGIPVGIGANLSLPGPADNILADRKIPIGLYRTEFLCLANNDFPDEETQYNYYSAIADRFAPTPVILRAFDLGYDKITPFGEWVPEKNPALGWRGIRALLGTEKIFGTQIRAILRASVHKNLKIMLPMVSDSQEIYKANKIISQVKLNLRRKGIEHDPDIQVGIMVEIPSAAMTASTLAKCVDFISIGTNDLTQYTLAADRMNNRVGDLYNPLHPAVLNLINMTVKACKKEAIPISICGELAGDERALPLFIGMGVDLLSMTPNRIVDICRNVKRIDSSLVQHLVGSVMACGTVQQVMNCLDDFSKAIKRK